MWILAVLLVLVALSLIEYVLHRFVMHNTRFNKMFPGLGKTTLFYSREITPRSFLQEV